MIYKVFGQNVRKATPIEEINNNDLREIIADLTSEILNDMTFEEININDEKVFDKVYDTISSMIEEDFNKYGLIGCGDYNVISSEDFPTRPNMAAGTTYDEQEIISYMNRE